MKMTYEDMSMWKRRFLRRHFGKLERQLMARDDKGIFLALRIVSVKEFLAKSDYDVYKRELMKLYIENFGGDISLDEILKRIEERRALHHKIRYDGEKFPWTEVADNFVNETRQLKILNHITNWYCCKIALVVYTELLDALKKGASDDELKKIIHRWDEPKTKAEVNEGKESFSVGFEWSNGEKASEKLYEKLLSGNFIDTKTGKKNFETIFNSQPVEEKVRWIASLPHLIYLFNKLAKSELKIPASIDNFIEMEKWQRGEQKQFSTWLYPRLCSCFVDEKGEELSSKKLRNAANQANNRSKPIRASDIDAILKAMEKI